MTHDEKLIREAFNRFVECWQKAETDQLDEILESDCVIDFSIFKKVITVEELKKELAVKTKKTTYSRFEVYNFVCAHNETEASVAGSIQGIFVNEEDHPSNYTFNAFTGCSLVKKDGNWKFDTLRLILGSGSDNHARLRTTGVSIDYGDGDTDFVANWNLITNEVGWHEGSRITSVVPEEDCPWYAIKDRLNHGTDEEQIEECFYRYCYGLDYDCLDLYDDVFAEDASAVYYDDRIYDKRGVTAMLRYEREGMIGMGHIMAFSSIDVCKDHAKAHAYRTGYLPGPLLFGDSKFLNHVVARYDLEFVRENGLWKILKLNYYPGRLTVPFSTDTFISESGK